MSTDRVFLPGEARPARPPSFGVHRRERQTTVLIVGYRRPDLLRRCLSGVAEHLPGLTVRVWDNSGPDAPGRAELIADHPDVDWHVSDTNVGFAAAVNALAGKAGEDDFLLLNPDAELLGPLTRTFAALDRHDVAAAAPYVIDERAGRRPWDVAHRPAGVVRALVAHSGYAERLRGAPVSDLYGTAPGEVEGYLTGACLLVSRAAWEAVGPFDEEFFLYGEESDWQHRARAAGWRLRLAAEVGARHAGHGTVAGDPVAAGRSSDLLRANVALGLEHARGVHSADAFLAGTSVLDRVQRSTRRTRASARRSRATARTSVIITVNRLVFGGAERHHAILAAELRRRGYDVTIVCLQRLGPLLAEIDSAVRVVRQPWWAPAVDAAEGRPAVLISGDTNTETGFAALWRRGPGERRWLVGAHVPPAADGPTYGRALARGMSAADGFVALSPRHWEQVSGQQHVGRRHFVAPNGVAPVGATARESKGGRSLRLVMLSRIVEHKNPHLLVEALAGLTDLDWELTIFGDGPDRARLQAMTPTAFRDRVHWQGWVAGPDAAFADCDLCCVPSGSEAFPLVIVEAMARGIPVIASAVCAVPDMLDHGRAGLLVDPVEVDAWTAALRRALTVEDLPAIGRAGRERMLAHYTVAAMADAYEAAMDDVLNAGR